MKILHFGNMANVAVELARAERSLGHNARVIAFRQDLFKEEADEQFLGFGPVGWNMAARRISKNWPSLDVLHIHGGIWRSQIYYRFLRRRMPSTAWVVHLHGSEARTGKGLHHMDLADLIAVSTADLTAEVPAAEWLPNPVSVPDDVPALREGERITFGHFPTNRTVKGTEAILQAFAQAFGPAKVGNNSAGTDRRIWESVELVVGERLSHGRVMELMAECDAVVDHLSSLGPVSLVALEAMARGRAAISSFDATRYPAECPVLRITPDDAVTMFREIAADRGALRRAGVAGRRYVQEHHDPAKVARQAIGLYERALRTRAARERNRG